MISSEKVEPVMNPTDTGTITSTKQNKWNEQPHIGKYKLIKTIGKGNFAKVKLAQHVTTGKKVAVKVIDKTALNNSSLQKLSREVKIMKALEHPNIVKLFEVIESERHVYLVMEYASRGEVFDFLVQNGRMKEKEARQRFREIVSAIQYCHQKNIVHRDLKAENLLLSCDLEIKIADFGFANNFDCKKQLDTFCGSPPYAAPELFQGRKYEGPEVDVWSLGVILYTLVSGSLPFDGHNMRELRERVLRGKYRVPFYMSTDCELLLKKMLIVSPQKRYTLLEVMKDKWINIGYEDAILQPYKEPIKHYDDPVRIAIMENLGFTKEEVLDSLYNAKFNNVTATYLLLDHDVNNALESSSKSESVSSLKNISSYMAAKDVSKVISRGSDKPTKGVQRSGSTVDTKTSTKASTNGDSKDLHYFPQKELTGEDQLNNTDSTLKVKHNKMTTSIKQSPSMGITNTFSNDEDSHFAHASLRARPNPIRIPGIQPNINSIAPKTNDDQTEMSNGDNSLMTTKNSAWVKRHNTFTYADKNTAFGVESKPVKRTKHVMNMLNQATPSPVPLQLDQPMLISSKKRGSNDVMIKHSKTLDKKSVKTCHVVTEPSTGGPVLDEVPIKIKDQPTATGDRVGANTLASYDQTNATNVPRDEVIHNLPPTQSYIPNQPPDAIVTSNNDPNEFYPQLNKPKEVHSGNLFRSFTNKISSNKLIRRLTSQYPVANRNKRASEYDACMSTDPWTPMDNAGVSTEKRKISASSDLTGSKPSSLTKAHQTSTLKPNQSKPRLMHLVFRKSLSSKLRPDIIIAEMLKWISTTEEIEFKKVEQIDTFVIECQGRLKSELGGNELINWEIEVFRLPRSSAFGIRIKKESGSSTRFKAIQKILVTRLWPVLGTSASVVDYTN